MGRRNIKWRDLSKNCRTKKEVLFAEKGENHENRDFSGRFYSREEVKLYMIWVVIVAIMVAAAALMIYLYQDHIHYLENKIHNLKGELELTADCLKAHEEMVEDLEGYYEKWR